MRSFVRLVSPIGESSFLLRRALNAANPSAFNVYSRQLSTSQPHQVARCIKVAEFSDNNLQEIVSGLSGQIKVDETNLVARIGLDDSAVLQSSSYDVDNNEDDIFGKIILASTDKSILRYGDTGFLPSQNVGPKDLLKHHLELPEKSLMVLRVRNHTPFLIETPDSTKAFALSLSRLSTIANYSRAEIEKKAELAFTLRLPEDIARIVHIKLQDRIFSDRNNERFHEEVTSVVDKPTIYNRSSGTLMNFERRRFGIDNTTESHYHPGDRRLHIFTISKEAGVTLNFCGISEDPSARKDCEVRLEFPENSMIILKFPAYTHHKFHGDFACISVHTEDGPNIIEAVKSGTLPKGFLESATVFSRKKEDASSWSLSNLESLKGSVTDKYRS